MDGCCSPDREERQRRRCRDAGQRDSLAVTRALPFLLLAASLAPACSGDGSGGDVRFRTARIERGEVVEGVQASGTVQPIELVQVGTQVSGVIQRLDVDFNSKVHAGQTIAVLDKRHLEAQVAQDDAALARARADLERLGAVLAQTRSEVERVRAAGAEAEADVARTRARLTQADHELERQRTLAEERVISTADLDTAVANQAAAAADLVAAQAAVRLNAAQVAAAESTVQQGEAELLVGEASVRQSQAQLDGDQVNLEYATITSPIDGVVVSRNVDVGQTVAASLQAPTLFVIANDLTKIQVQTSVPEADIGRLHEGQPVRFSVDAHPDRSFEGVVSQVRLAATTVQNVVTYTVVVDAPNPDGLLLPGMTANVVFEIRRSAPDALHVSAAALRLRPPESLLAGRPAAPAQRPATAPALPSDGDVAREPREPGTLYVRTEDDRLRAVPVLTGLSDGVVTVVEVPAGETLAEGTEVVTAALTQASSTTNPFGPPPVGAPRGVR